MQFSPDGNGSGNRHWELSVPMLRTQAGEQIKFRIPHPTMHTLVLWTAAANLSQGIASHFEIAAADLVHLVVFGLAVVFGRRLARSRSDRTPRIVGALIGGTSLATTLAAGGQLWSVPAAIGAALFLINVVGLLCSLRSNRAQDASQDPGAIDEDVVTVPANDAGADSKQDNSNEERVL
ncbi:hypothetical protein ACFWN2_06070 [Lentzea sp. NPDC058436]|uniref:hypothetical protein n=1 Tax=Lentzea sp. NPDC058436 TaxID=3346499 RepID=UPI00365E1C80